MIAVAGVALSINLVLVALKMSQRAADFRRRANVEALHVNSFGIAVTEGGKLIGRDELLRLNRQWREHHELLRRKYEYAADHPWFPVPADPPDPVADGTPGREVKSWTE